MQLHVYSLVAFREAYSFDILGHGYAGLVIAIEVSLITVKAGYVTLGISQLKLLSAIQYLDTFSGTYFLLNRILDHARIVIELGIIRLLIAALGRYHKQIEQ